MTAQELGSPITIIGASSSIDDLAGSRHNGLHFTFSISYGTKGIVCRQNSLGMAMSDDI